MSSKKIKIAAALAAILVVLSACATATPEVVEKVITKEVEKVVTQVVKETVKETVIVEGTPQVIEKEVTKVVEKVVTATPEPESPLANTLVIAEQEHPASFDPMQTGDSTVNRITALAYDALVQYKQGVTEIIPWLATEWEISDDGLTYTFKLREDVKFHDGSDLTASDVKFTFDRLQEINEGIASSLTSANYDSAEVIDDYTVALKLKEASAPFFAVLPKIFIISEDGVKANEKDGDWARTYLEDHELGSGPYALTNFVPEQQAVFEKFDDYWQGWEGKHVDNVIYLYIKESATQRLMLEKGEVDMAKDIAYDDLPVLAQNPDLQITEGGTFVEYLINIRTIHKPLDDVRVRKAIVMVYDYDAHIEVALGGHGDRAQGPVSRAIFWHNDDLEMPPYDIEAAKALLAEAGWEDRDGDGILEDKDGNDFPTLRIAYLPVLDEEARSVEILQAGLEQLGIELEAEGMTWPTLVNVMSDEASRPDFYTVYNFPSSADPHGAGLRSFHTERLGICCNASWYINPEVDELLDKGAVSLDLAEREKIYKRAQQIINDDYPAIFVSNPTHIMVARNWVKGYNYNPGHHETVWAYYIWLDGKP